jgi:hypothetical protein
MQCREPGKKEGAGVSDERVEPCWLCRRPLGRRVERHHPLPRSRGGCETVAVHPICHRAIHANFTNAELARLGGGANELAGAPAMRRFLGWIAGKPADFHAVTLAKRRRR